MFAQSPEWSRFRDFGATFVVVVGMLTGPGESRAAMPNHPLEEKFWRKKTVEPDPEELPVVDYNFPYPVNPIGWSDYNGTLSIWVNGDWKVNLGGGETLPLRFKFSSDQDRIEDGLLGEGWWIPLLESRVLLRYDGSVRITALGGESYYYYHHRDRPGTLRSRNRQWNATGKIEGLLEVTGPGGWSYRYDRGRIVRAISPGGREVRWLYDENDRVEALTDREGKSLLEVCREGSGGVRSIRLAGGVAIEVRDGFIPDFPGNGSGTSFSGLSRCARALVEIGPDGRFSRRFELQVSAVGQDNLRAVYLNTGSNGVRERTRLEWESVGGKRLLSDNDSTYRFDRWIDGVGHRSGAILRRFGEEECEYYHYDPQNRIDIRIRRDGSVYERSYHRRSGPTYMKLSRVREGRFAGGKVSFHRERVYHYDEFGNSIEPDRNRFPRR